MPTEETGGGAVAPLRVKALSRSPEWRALGPPGSDDVMNMAVKRIFMKTPQACPSLSDLRNKTDRQLVALARREIECSLSLASRGAIAEAEAKRLQARTLLNVAPAPAWQRREIGARLDRARAAIERARSAPMTFMRSACC